jgi:hypothetical protein
MSPALLPALLLAILPEFLPTVLFDDAAANIVISGSKSPMGAGVDAALFAPSQDKNTTALSTKPALATGRAHGPRSAEITRSGKLRLSNPGEIAAGTVALCIDCMAILPG